MTAAGFWLTFASCPLTAVILWPHTATRLARRVPGVQATWDTTYRHVARGKEQP